MGIDSRKAPPLPAPTETETNNTTPTELTADAFKPSDEKSSYSIPEDGTPLTIATRGRKASRSQTSLLIEYFEGGKPSSGSGERRPSVRVRLTPSKRSRDNHIQVTETKGSHQTSLTRRIPLSLTNDLEYYDEDGNSMTSYASATEESNVSRNPIDIEIDHSHRRRRPASPLIPSESYQVNPSDISAIPTDSFLDGTGGGSTELKPLGQSKGELAAAAGAGALAGAAMDEIRSHKVRNRDRSKVPEKSKDKSDRKRRPKSRTSSVSERTTDELKAPRTRRSSRSHQESAVSAADTSVLSNLTPSHRSADTHSTGRSGVSKSSINNPKLLETVEDAIRRLILPELSALKREQSKRETRRGSFTSTATSLSREEATPDRRRSSGQRSDQKDKRNREARHEYGDSSLHSISRESIDDGYHYDNESVTPKRSGGDLLRTAAAGAAAGKGQSLLDDKSQSEDRKRGERRRRRAESSRSRSLGPDRYAEEFDDDHLVPAPPMPLMSEINASEMTRTSILSANTDRPHSATEELTPVQNVNRGSLSVTSTPTPSRTPTDLDNTLLTQHANVSHGDLTALPRGQKDYEEYETNEFGSKVPIDDVEYDDEDAQDVSDNGDYPDHGYDNSYFATQDVPPPLKYVPYQAGARGLSPIPSVSGYTDGASEHQPRNSRSMHSTSDVYSALERRSPEHPRNSRSTGSLNSMQARELDHMSPRSSGADYRNTTYTDDSELDRVTSGQAVRGIGANPNIIHPVMGVESNVASLIDGSMLDQSVLTSGSGYDYGGPRDSNLSYDARSYSSRGVSPVKQFTENTREVEAERHATPGARSNKPSQEFTEYEIDEHGRKVLRTKSPTASEVAITAGAVAALKAAQGKRQAPIEEEIAEDGFQPAGVFRNKSFKERTMEGHEPRNTPTHSIDRLDYDEPPKMSASFVPDLHNTMPEFGYVDDDVLTNPSVVHDRLDGQHGDDQMSGRATPTQRSIGEFHQDELRSKASGTSGRGLGLAEAGALGAAAGMAAAHTHSREPSHDHDEWQRSSEDHKRDTLVTNPYEDASPIANPALNENLLGSRGMDDSYGAGYHSGSPGFTQKYDEGYMSNGPNRTPDMDPKTGTLDLPGATLVAPNGEDPFYVPKDARHLSGMSQGMASPFYDAATGQGIERIENKDIVALMQHLMVRDAQRSARDTEIVALLMNAALEMRNSFREMKDLIQDTGDDVIFSNAENTEKLQKAINGPRPYPGTGSRSIQSASQVDTINDVAAKKKNLWKRALQGLSAKGTSDLSRIEDMLMQLLGEVDVLKTQTARPVSTIAGRSPIFDSLQPEEHYEQDRGYEPEGNSTASHASQSGHLSVSHSRSKLRDERMFSDNRISTVQEHEEEYQYDHPSPAGERTDPNLLTPTRSAGNLQRGSSVPLDTPPQPSGSNQQPMSAENTPRTGKKHKASGSSGWLPKISRWSGTTASSVGKAFRGSGKKESKYEDYAPSRSGSSLASYNDEDEYGHDQHNQRSHHNPYEEDKLHQGFSEQNLAGTAAEPTLDATVTRRDSNFTPDEAPKYKVHRNSLNLQHPQPRPGQTERFRNALEYSAQEYDIPMTPRSADWAGSATSVNRLPQNTNRYSTASSAGAREPEYWGSSPTGPPRPPKEPIDNSGTRTPPKSSRISKLAKGSPLQHQSDESGYATMSGTHASQTTGSPKPENRNLNTALGVPTRRPSGPRAMTPKSAEKEAAIEAARERRRKRDTFGSIASHHSQQSELSDDTDTF